MPEVNPLDRFNTLGLAEADTSAVEEIESLGWAISTSAPANLREGIPSVVQAERVGSIPLRRCQSHSLTGLLRAVQADLARRGEAPSVQIDTDAVHHSVTTIPTGDQR